MKTPIRGRKGPSRAPICADARFLLRRPVPSRAAPAQRTLFADARSIVIGAIALTKWSAGSCARCRVPRQRHRPPWLPAAASRRATPTRVSALKWQWKECGGRAGAGRAHLKSRTRSVRVNWSSGVAGRYVRTSLSVRNSSYLLEPVVRHSMQVMNDEKGTDYVQF